MKNALFGAIAIAISLGLYQNCGESSKTVLNGNGPGQQTTNPTISFDSTNLNLNSGQSNFTVTGNCSGGSYSNYYFEFGFRSSAGAELFVRPSGVSCLSARYSANITTASLGITPGLTGTLLGRLVGIAETREIPSAQALANVAWGSSTGGSGTTTGGMTTGGTTAGSTSGTTGSGPTVCGAMTLFHAVRCTGGSACTSVGPMIPDLTVEECKTQCQNLRARCCEYELSRGECYPGTGSGCAIQNGFSHWQSAACN